MKIIDYYIVCATRIKDLEWRVLEKIKDDWQPFGSHVVEYQLDEVIYSQAMVRYCEST